MGNFYFDNKRVHYTERGAGPPLLLLHGNAASSNLFYGVVDRYAKTHRVILIDFLGHGGSDRLDVFPTDFWHYEAEQVCAFLRERGGQKTDIIGTSGGALAAINVALEAPAYVRKVIADSFEGERALKSIAENMAAGREVEKRDPDTRMFFYHMHGDDWEQVVDCDTRVIQRHYREIGRFFHKELHTLEPDVLLTGSRADEFVTALAPDYFATVYGEMIRKIGHGRIHLFETGGHPAMLTNHDTFYALSQTFFQR